LPLLLSAFSYYFVVEFCDTASILEDLVRELRRLVLDSQRYFAQATRPPTESAMHQKREQRVAEIRDQLARMMKQQSDNGVPHGRA
jgi:hypothetical protein